MPWKPFLFRDKNQSSQTQTKRCKQLIFSYSISTFLQMAPVFETQTLRHKARPGPLLFPPKHATSPDYSRHFFLSLFENLVRMETFSGFKFPKGERLKKRDRESAHAGVSMGRRICLPSCTCRNNSHHGWLFEQFPSFPGLHVHP